MPRLIYHDAVGPVEIKPQTKSVWICMCGLSQTLPVCDGSHKTARVTEQPTKCYLYDCARRSVLEVRDAPPGVGRDNAPQPPDGTPSDT